MEKYSAEWKEKQGAWVQDHKNEKWGRFYKVHYIKAGTEYSQGEYLTRADAEDALAIYKSAAALGRIKSEKKAMAARKNGKKGGRPRKTTDQKGEGD